MGVGKANAYVLKLSFGMILKLSFRLQTWRYNLGKNYPIFLLQNGSKNAIIKA